MNMSEQINELATALAKAQGVIENAVKGSSNPHFRSKYADLAEVINCARPVLSDHGISFSQCPMYADGIVSVETIMMHSSGQWISSIISAPVSKQDAQGVGSATTYCRRYSLAAMVGLAQEDDDAESAVGRSAKQPAKVDIPRGDRKTRAEIERELRSCTDEPTLNAVWLDNKAFMTSADKEALTKVAKQVKATFTEQGAA